MTLSEAVGILRKRMNMSQQAFATELGLSISAIAKYDTGRQPSGRALFELGNAARKHGQIFLASIFFAALFDELNASAEDMALAAGLLDKMEAK